MKANELKQHLGTVVKTIEKIHAKPRIEVKKPRMGPASIDIYLTGIKNDIECGAFIEETMRTIYGIGSFEKTYNHNTFEFSANFKPLPVNRELTSSSESLYDAPSKKKKPKSDTPGVME